MCPNYFPLRSIYIINMRVSTVDSVVIYLVYKFRKCLILRVNEGKENYIASASPCKQTHNTMSNPTQLYIT